MTFFGVLLGGQKVAAGYQEILMRRKIPGLFFTLIAGVIFAGVISRADDAKSPAPKEEKPSVGEVRTQTLNGFTYFYSNTRVKFQDLAEKLGVLIPELKKGVEKSHARVAGPLIFIYHGVTEDPNAEFDLEVGFSIEEKVPVDGIFKVRDVGEYRCMSVLFTGSNDHFSSAYEKLMPAVMGPAVTRTGESREMYLYFEDPKSPNNVVHVSVGIK